MVNFKDKDLRDALKDIVHSGTGPQLDNANRLAVEAKLEARQVIDRLKMLEEYLNIEKVHIEAVNKYVTKVLPNGLA